MYVGSVSSDLHPRLSHAVALRLFALADQVGPKRGPHFIIRHPVAKQRQALASDASPRAERPFTSELQRNDRRLHRTGDTIAENCNLPNRFLRFPWHHIGSDDLEIDSRDEWLAPVVALRLGMYVGSVSSDLHPRLSHAVALRLLAPDD